MATSTVFYIQNTNFNDIIEKIEILSYTQAIFGQEFSDKKMFDFKDFPTYLALNQSDNGWVTVIHNSFNFLEDWGSKISKEFACKVIFTMAQSVSDTYYFALYENGLKKREILSCLGNESENINFGNFLEFENGKLGKKYHFEGHDSYVFNNEAIVEYCQNLGLKFDNNNDWTILENVQIKEKPWWKFW